jgi:hypothetical protein
MAMRLRGEPDLRWPSTRLPDPRLSLAAAHKQCERGANSITGLMPAEQVANGRPGHPLPASVLEGAQDLIGDVVAQAGPEDVRGGRLGVFPHGQGRLDVREVDIRRAVEQRVDECQSNRLRFCP